LLRLHRCLTQVKPASVADFFRLATVQIRRELLDLAKRHRGPESMAANHHTDAHGHAADDEDGPLRQQDDKADGPMTLEGWTAFHEAVEGLPDEEQAVVDLIWYEGMGQEQAAAVLGISLRTLKRRWQAARVRLFEALGGEPPRC
jgi:RNA polymerase sigma-70 factor (ECF subfamily)